MPKGMCNMCPLAVIFCRGFATPLIATQLRAWGGAPNGIAAWSSLLVLICSFFHATVGRPTIHDSRDN
eukprot:5446240-Pyramimonas_sp.AAC.1